MQQSALHGNAGAPASCTALDDADTVCDQVDEDCDGAIDEDCDFGPSSCRAGTRIVRGTRGNDVLNGSVFSDCILGYGGDDVITGHSGDDVLIGGPGDDRIEGGSGNDRIEGGDGNDRIDAGNGNDSVSGGMCHDTVHGSNGVDDLRGEEGSDRLISARFHNRVDGGSGIDACSGTSCEVSLFTRQCARDSDCSGGKRCVVATGICASPNDVAFTDPTCDDVDDDCDGENDEEYVAPETTCGVGACAASGEAACVGGELEDTCVPGEPADDDASCDAVDDDCNGQSDEDFVGSATSCGVGACVAAGTSTCVGGSIAPSCTPGTPAAHDASCNAVDDDCNGQNDEDFVGSSISCGVGACAATGTTTCAGGNVQNSCTPGTPAANDASCNAVDDDCNGQNDEDFVGSNISCGVGACAATGTTTCAGGSVQNSCTPGAPTGNDASCNGIDEDCDGRVDEHYSPQSTLCGAGACRASGVTSCSNGQEQDSCSPGAPAANDAACNGIDEDCDGENDEDYAAQMTVCGTGACQASGVTSCSNGSEQDSCAASAPAANDESCDGVDDDCDGANDEDFLSTITTCGVGACASMGATSCNGGVVNDSCSASSAGPSDFTCDGVDDDCNGASDEDYASHATFCGVGACGASGASSCVGGVEQDNCAPGSPSQSDATCDGFDDDCNGAADEDYQPLATDCGVGACAATGTTSCEAGNVEDSCAPGAPAENDASCNGVDDDCSGAADEDFQASCSGSQRSTCAGGQLQVVDCNDGNACNGAESCSAGTCVAGTALSVDDGDPCTSDSCDPQNGSISHTAVAPGTSCSDGNVCNGEELCLEASACEEVPTGAVAWWRGENNANDSHGSNHGTLVNGTTFAAGQVEQAFSFDGSNDAVRLDAHASALNLSGQATIELWLKTSLDLCRTVFHLQQDGTHEHFLQIGPCTGALTNELVTFTHINDRAASIVGTTDATRTTLFDNNWHHLAVTFDGTQTRFFIDGTMRATSIGVGANHGDWGGFATATRASIGARWQTDRYASVVNGRLDEVTLYNRPLSAGEISAIHAAGADGKCDGGGGGGALTCTPGDAAPSGTTCDDGGTCDGAGMCSP